MVHWAFASLSEYIDKQNVLLQFNRPGELPILLHPMLYKSDADQLYGEYYDHGLRAYWLGPQVRRTPPALPFSGSSVLLASYDIPMRMAIMRRYLIWVWSSWQTLI